MTHTDPQRATGAPAASRPVANERYLIRPVANAFAVLEAIARIDRPFPLEEIVAVSGLPRTTAFRHLRTLVTLGYLSRRRDRRYEIGPAVGLFLPSAVADHGLCALAEAELIELSRAFSATANLAVARGKRVQYLRVLHGKDAPPSRSEDGDSDYLHSTALGKAVLASLGADERRKHLNAELPRLTARTTTDHRELDRRLSQARSTGYAIDREENEVGWTCVAAAIVRDGIGPIGAVSVSLPAQRLTAKLEMRLADAVTASARRIAASGIGHVLDIRRPAPIALPFPRDGSRPP